MKKRLIPLILTVLIWAGLYYYYLPPLNIHSRDSWMFIITAIVMGVIINFWTIFRAVFLDRTSTERAKNKKVMKKLLIIPVGLLAVFIGGTILSSPILRASAYNKLLNVETGDFATDIHEVDYNKIPILDSDSAAKLAEREMGSMVDMVSQYEVSSYFNQINYQNKPVRVTPLRYGDLIKWVTNRNTGIPAYIQIDMTTQNVDLVKLEQGIKYSPFEHFGRNLYRYVRFRYPTAMIRSTNFEIDEEGVPYWVCSVENKTIGLFGGTDIKGAVVVNAVTGEHTYYNIEDVPRWIDKVYDANLLIEQYDYYGTLKKGYLNSIFGQRECLQGTEGYNYIALDDDVWVYTGVTSIGGDESNVGFVLMNSRTKETKYYQISGAKEISAMSSAEGQVQHLGYNATFPILLNIADEPTYFLSLKDGAGLVKKYAMVNIQKYQIVAIGDTVAECEKVYRNLMAGNGINTIDSNKAAKVSGTITVMKDIVEDGNTYYYLMLDSSDELFEIEVKNYLSILKKQVGDTISLEYVAETGGVNVVIGLE
ncbi:CvpA family protein [Anaerotignum sp.]|uniref:CvpA family protein n=1 Tax=Anaerotignum sp. TaxID=2039241 RepID=UPI0027150C64|nr:CvpA family protein [Anaerotignum sp.]